MTVGRVEQDAGLAAPGSGCALRRAALRGHVQRPGEDRAVQLHAFLDARAARAELCSAERAADSTRRPLRGRDGVPSSPSPTEPRRLLLSERWRWSVVHEWWCVHGDGHPHQQLRDARLWRPQARSGHQHHRYVHVRRLDPGHVRPSSPAGARQDQAGADHWLAQNAGGCVLHAEPKCGHPFRVERGLPDSVLRLY